MVHLGQVFWIGEIRLGNKSLDFVVFTVNLDPQVSLAILAPECPVGFMNSTSRYEYFAYAADKNIQCRMKPYLISHFSL